MLRGCKAQSAAHAEACGQERGALSYQGEKQPRLETDVWAPRSSWEGQPGVPYRGFGMRFTTAKP